MLRLLGSGAVLYLPDFSIDSLRAVVRFAMVGEVVVEHAEVEEVINLGKTLKLDMIKEVGGGRESWRHYESPRCSCHLSRRWGRRRRRRLCLRMTYRLFKPHSHPY